MWVAKYFNGLGQSGPGGETGPTTVECGQSGHNLMTGLAYELFEASDIGGCEVDMHAVVDFLLGDLDARPLTSVETKKESVANLYVAILQMLQDQKFNATERQLLLRFQTTVEAAFLKVNNPAQAIYLEKLRQIKTEFDKMGLQITDRDAFVESLKQAIVDSNQDGLENGVVYELG